MKALIIAICLAVAPCLMTAPALAANADAPDQKVDKSNDAGGSTGNAQVDRLNDGQLDRNQRPREAGPGDPPPK